jgi:hypothetical protein
MASCSGTSYDTVYPTLSDGKYDSEFPYRNCSEQLENIAQSLVKLDVLVFYHTYSFTHESRTTLEAIRSSDSKLSDLASSTDIFTESVGGTASTIYYNGNHIAFLSCAHIVDYPDTVISYYPYPDDKIIQVIGVKARQENNISTISGGDGMEILAIDKDADIVIIGKEFQAEELQNINLMNYPLGESEELEWGSFVYMMGFPLGHAMITRGIVSDPQRIRKGTFLIDAVFNHGFSGGPVIAVRDGVPNFEIVGMIKSSAAENKLYIVPGDAHNKNELNFLEPYNGKLKLKSEKDIKYGITFSVTTEILRNFYKKNKQSLKEKGYDLDEFFLAGN